MYIESYIHDASVI